MRGAHDGGETSKARADRKDRGANAPRPFDLLVLNRSYRPASRASLEGVPPMRLISHSIADWGGI